MAVADRWTHERECPVCGSVFETRAPRFVRSFCGIGCQFMEKVEMREDGCWEWLACRSESGRPTVSSPVWAISPGGYPMPMSAQVVLYAMRWLEWPEAVVDTCGDRWCVNPEHLRSVTTLEVRQAHAARGPLSAEVVRRVRAAYEEEGASIRGVASEMGMSKGCVESILNGETYQWVT